MTSKLSDSPAAPKTYWVLLNCLLYNTKISAIPALLADENVFSGFHEKADILITYLHQYVLL